MCVIEIWGLLGSTVRSLGSFLKKDVLVWSNVSTLASVFSNGEHGSSVLMVSSVRWKVNEELIILKKGASNDDDSGEGEKKWNFSVCSDQSNIR